jgi:sec-independent protein translocase protein TatA
MALDPLELIVIAVIVVVVLMWGPKKIPELARSLGQARKEFATAQVEGQPAGGQPGQPAIPRDDLIDTARKLGISTEGKTRQQISDEIVKRVQAFS